MPNVAERIVVSESGYEFPVEDILTGRGAVFGKSGSGKSNTATVIAEELLEEGLPLLIVDQDGEYHGLAAEYDEVVHYGAGDDCDRTVGAGDGEAVADAALGKNTPVVLDVSGFMQADAARELVYDVVRRLFQRENDVQKPFLLVVEEVHEYIPEQGGLDDLGEMLVRIAKRGRKRGLGICGISQRPASVDKDFITQCDWIVWHRLTWNNDTKVVGRILGSDYADRVQDLDDGEAQVMTDWSEDVSRVRFRLKRSADVGATPGLESVQSFTHPSGDTEVYDPEAAGTDTLDDAGAPGRTDPPPADTPQVEVEMPSAGDGQDPQASLPASTDGAGTADVDVNRGNPVWEFGQMILFLLSMLGSGLARAANTVLPGRSPGPDRVSRTSGSPYGSDDWRRIALVLLLLNLLLGAGVLYFAVLQ
jgi:hypothetical protein